MIKNQYMHSEKHTHFAKEQCWYCGSLSHCQSGLNLDRKQIIQVTLPTDRQLIFASSFTRESSE